MKTTLPILNNENGSLLAIVLLLMAVLTVIGIRMSDTAVTEARIARNETCYKRSFFRAEAAAMEAIQQLEDTTTDLDIAAPSYLRPIGTIISTPNEELPDAEWNFAAPSAIPDTSSDLKYLAVATGIQVGSSMAMGEAQVHSYVVYGRDEDSCGGKVTVGIGYTKPF